MEPVLSVAFVSPLSYSASDIAGQLTLIDIKLFSRINSWELTGGVWVGRDKKIQAVNVSSLTKQFNNITYWVKQSILAVNEVQLRAYVIQRFIKICKKLFKLNNINSLFSINAALESAPIHRLSLTWKFVSKKRKDEMKNFQAILDAQDNYKSMREYLEKTSLPCIPYIGVFLTDIMYMETAKKNGNDANGVLDPVNAIANFQTSNYDFIDQNHELFDKLTQDLYIEELQKFRNDEDYERSLFLENINAEKSRKSCFSFLTSKQSFTTPGRAKHTKDNHRRYNSNFTTSDIHKAQIKREVRLSESHGNKSFNMPRKDSNNSNALNEIFTPGAVDPYRQSMVLCEAVKPIINGYLKVRVFSRKNKLIKSKYKKFFVTLKSNGELSHVNTKKSSKNFSFNIKNKDTFVMAQNTSIMIHFRQEDIKYEYKLVFDKNDSSTNADDEMNMVKFWVKIMLDICTMTKTYGIAGQENNSRRFYDDYSDLMNFDK